MKYSSKLEIVWRVYLYFLNRQLQLYLTFVKLSSFRLLRILRQTSTLQILFVQCSYTNPDT
jgi:hypothetical protein